MSDYATFIGKIERHGLSCEQLGDLIEEYAAALEAAEPGAVNSIAAAKETADGIRFLEDER